MTNQDKYNSKIKRKNDKVSHTSNENKSRKNRYLIEKKNLLFIEETNSIRKHFI